MSEMTKEVSVTPVCASAFQALVESGPMSIAFPKAAKKLLRAPFAGSLWILTPHRSQQYTSASEG
jgi:hypothetical protein